MAAYNGLKFAKDSISSLIQGKVELETQSRILEALGKVGSAQDALFEIRDELFALQTENARLKAETEKAGAWADRLASYELYKATGGAVVLRSRGEPEHFACPSCVNNHKLEILQDNRTFRGLFRCTGCKAEYPVNPRQPAPQHPPSRGGWT